jgi:VWFA-related protein
MAKRTITAALLPAFAVGVASALLLANASSSGQQPETSSPTFRSGVDLLRVPVSVIDGQGQPVRDLTASDFSVTVDGWDRKLRFAHFFGPAGDGLPGVAATPPSYAINTASIGGRAVVFVVDLISIKQGYEKSILDTAAALVDRLRPNDAVGLMPIPGKGVEITRDRAQVSGALRLLRGTTHVPFITHYFTLSEAVAFEQLNRRVISETIERECCVTCMACPNDLRDETREMLRYARSHVQTVLTSLTALAAALQRVDAPKTIVLLSAGLPFEQESLALFSDLQQALSRAGILIYAVQVSQPDNDASNMRRPGVGTYQAADVTTGLANVATMAGGAMFMGVGTGRGSFERLRTEIVHSYELGVEGTAADADGKSHDIKVKVNRPGVTVRSRPRLFLTNDVIEPSRRLANLLSQPIDVPDLPIAATAYTVRGEEPATLKVIITAELARGMKVSPPLRYALMVTQGTRSVFETNDTAAEGAEGSRVLTAAQLAPGQYRLRLGAIDGSGRGGTVDMPLAVALQTAGGLQFSDVIVGVTGQSFTPVIRARAGEALDALVELYTAEPARFASATVVFELRSTGATAVATAQGTLGVTALERRQIAEGSLATKGLTPGDYTVTAVIAVDGKPVGRVNRGVVLEP